MGYHEVGINNPGNADTESIYNLSLIQFGARRTFTYIVLKTRYYIPEDSRMAQH